MTTINLHGILAREFGNSFSMKIKKPKQVIDAITCNKASFKKRILELNQQGIHYTILIDGENITTERQLEIIKENTVIDFAPVICGQGFVALLTTIGGALLGGGAGAAAVGGLFATAAGAAAQATLLSSILGGVLNMVALTVIQQALSPSEKPQRTEATVSGTKESFLISSKGNLAEQGIPVPVGYGRLRVGSYIVQSTVKSYPQKYQTRKALGRSSASHRK
jgi:predicted phage tail protein